jgi:hypothetical protein
MILLLKQVEHKLCTSSSRISSPAIDYFSHLGPNILLTNLLLEITYVAPLM